MTTLYNTLSAKQRKALIEAAGQDRLTISFYKYVHLDQPKVFRDQLFLKFDALEVLGRIYIAKEGINAQLSLPAENFDAFKLYLDNISFLQDVRLNIALEQDNLSFLKLKIKVRDKIVADGLDDTTFDVTDKGVHLSAEAFNTMLDDPDTILVDMRNHYESEIGHFKNAITPDVDTFRDSLDIIEKNVADHKEDKKLVMYCTGGIRCEKASAYYKHKGFRQVYQLEGGIIEYARQVKKRKLENKFIGKNFVFDDRRSERITDDIIAHCHQCGQPCDTHTNCANKACNLLFIQCENCAAVQTDNCCSDACQKIHAMTFEEQKALRMGKGNSNKIFKKGRSDVLKFKS